MGTYQGRHALIFAAAPETDYGYIRAFLREHPDALVACADGGLRHARALGLHPDFMISDRDSMTDVEGTDIVLLKPEKGRHGFAELFAGGVPPRLPRGDARVCDRRAHRPYAGKSLAA